MHLDVRSDYLETIHAILRNWVPEYRVVAFGSRVKNAAKNSSDLDLCIMSEERLSFETLANLRDSFSNSNIPFKVDVLDWSSLAPEFREIVAESCVDIQSAEHQSEG